MFKNAARVFFTTMLLLSLCLFPLSGCMLQPQLPVDRTLTPGTHRSPDASYKVQLVTGEFAPYTTQNPNESGFFSQIVAEVFENAGIETEIAFYPWSRCEQMVADGEALASFPYSHSSNATDQFLASDPVMTSEQKYYYRKSNPKITAETLAFTQLKQFAGYTFGGTGGYWYGTPRDFENLGIRAEWADGGDALLKMLQAGRIDFVIEDDLVCAQSLERLFPGQEDDFSTLPNISAKVEYYLIVSPTYPEAETLLKRFNDSLQELKRTGRIGDILAQYGVPPERALPAETAEP